MSLGSASALFPALNSQARHPLRPRLYAGIVLSESKLIGNALEATVNPYNNASSVPARERDETESFSHFARLGVWLALANGAAFLIVLNISFAARICDQSDLTRANIAFGLGVIATLLATTAMTLTAPQRRPANEHSSERAGPHPGTFRHLAWILIAFSSAALLYGGTTVTLIDHAAVLCQTPESMLSPEQSENFSDWIE